MANSMSAITAAATPLHENSKCGQLSRSLHQTTKQTPASTKHAPAFIDQTTVIQLIGIWRLRANHYLLRIFLGEVSKKVAKSHLNRCRRRWKNSGLGRHSRHSATVLSSDLRNNRTNEMIGDRETGHPPPRRPLQCSVQDDTLEHHFVLRRLWKR